MRTTQERVKPLVLINVVGLTEALIGEHTPFLKRFTEENGLAHLQESLPAVTTTAQACMLTGKPPAQHGIVGNGWYWRQQAEVKFWQQSNHIVEAPKVWQTIRETQPDFRCSNMFWWYNMYSDVDNAVTPRPHYPADGRKVVDLYSEPPELHQKLQRDHGTFPFFNFWGPTADIRSSDWIGRAAAAEFRQNRPDLQLVYLPHLDYNLQRLGPDPELVAEDLRQIDSVVEELVTSVKSDGAEVALVSEYGIFPVDKPVHVNRVLRDAGLLRVRESLGTELLDAGASRAFAVADHQVAHVYMKDVADLDEVKALLSKTPGIAHVLDREAMRIEGLDHERAGDLFVIADEDAWFSYYYWLDDSLAPDFAPTVDIHRKPGYDPAELFIDPGLRFPKLRVIRRLLQKKLGFRMLMDVIPLNGEQVKGSHGRPAKRSEDQPVFSSSASASINRPTSMTDVHRFLLSYFGITEQ